jgi:hypothetical protein
MGSPFCSTCGGFIVPGSKHSSEECKERTENNNQEHSNDTDAEQFKQPKHGWLVAYFQPFEKKNKFPNLYVYKVKNAPTAKGYTDTTVPKGSNFFTGIYVLYNTPYEKNGQKSELRLSKGILYYKVEKMHEKNDLKVPIKNVLWLPRDHILTLEEKLEARLNKEWRLEGNDSGLVIAVIRESLDLEIQK